MPPPQLANAAAAAARAAAAAAGKPAAARTAGATAVRVGAFGAVVALIHRALSDSPNQAASGSLSA
jgi:hypothetical protein